MMSQWHLPGQPTLPLVSEERPRSIERVLVEYDGPRWLVLRDIENRYLAYAADEDDDGHLVRWIETKVSNVELRAIYAGLLPLRDAILKSTVMVVDYDRARVPQRAWPMSADDIPEDCLPDVDAILPRFAREPAKEETKQRPRISFECDGPAVKKGVISFAALGAVTSALQNLWTSLGANVAGIVDTNTGWGPSTLVFAGHHDGSFGIDVSSDDAQSFHKIAAKYKAIVRAAYGPAEALQHTLAAYDARTSFAYRDYLQTLHVHAMDVLADWTDDGAFVGSDRAKRAHDEIESADEGDATPQPPTVIQAVGFFDGWMAIRRRFEFFTTDGYEMIGGVEPTLARAMLSRPPVLGRVEPGYSVTVRMTVNDAEKRDYKLLAFARRHG